MIQVICLDGVEVRQVICLDGVGTIINHGKVKLTNPCMYFRSLSLSDSEYTRGLATELAYMESRARAMAGEHPEHTNYQESKLNTFT